jgi:transcriptional regulator with XRE-family HTH domain
MEDSPDLHERGPPGGDSSVPPLSKQALADPQRMSELGVREACFGLRDLEVLAYRGPRACRNLTGHLPGIIVTVIAMSTLTRSMPWTPRDVAASLLREVEEHRRRVGERLRQLRKSRGWSQEDAAHEAGVAVKTWYRWESGKGLPYDANVKKLADIFDTTPEEILGVPPSPLGLGADPPEWALRLEEKLDELLTRLPPAPPETPQQEAASAAEEAAARSEAQRRGSSRSKRDRRQAGAA